MAFLSIQNSKESTCACEALILPVPEGEPAFYEEIDPLLSAHITKVFGKEFHGKLGEVFLIPWPSGLKPERILLAGLGRKTEITTEKLLHAGGRAVCHLRDLGMEKIAISARALLLLKLAPAHFLEGALLGLYRFTKYAKEEPGAIKHITLLCSPSKDIKESLLFAETAADAVCFARDLINTPANDMTPSDLSDAAMSLKSDRLSVKIIEKKEAEALGMGCFLSVAKGTSQPSKFIVMDYRGAKGKPLVLVGKSITFDSGGLSLKPSDGMEKMKYDMAGGAAVLGVMKAVAKLKMPVRLVGILPATENLPGGSASRPGDVVRAIDGQTVEIINTDAEGRLTLADAIGYARSLNPRGMIDIATLTGACAIAFGSVAIGMIGNNRMLLDAVRRAGDNVKEHVCEIPLSEECADYIKSDIADMKNTGGRSGSLVSSGYFLSRFAGDSPWVHLDIAGTAWREKEKPYLPKGASGVGVRLILNLIKEFQ